MSGPFDFSSRWQGQDFIELFENLIKKYNLATTELTERQFADAIRQAVSCGDFIRYTRHGDGAQQVIYIPFAREEELMQKIKELESTVSEFVAQGIQQ